MVSRPIFTSAMAAAGRVRPRLRPRTAAAVSVVVRFMAFSLELPCVTVVVLCCGRRGAAGEVRLAKRAG
ncbi:hypothetical protein D3C77_611830 [compost metagenome]